MPGEDKHVGGGTQGDPHTSPWTRSLMGFEDPENLAYEQEQNMAMIHFFFFFFPFSFPFSEVSLSLL